MYVKYCENKPKSESIVAEFIEFFEVHYTVLSVVHAVCELWSVIYSQQCLV